MDEVAEVGSRRNDGLLALVLLIIALAPAPDVATETPAASTQTRPSAPVACLEAPATLDRIESRGDGVWRGRFIGSGMVVVVKRLDSPAAARRAVKSADLVEASAGGSWFVHGPAKGAVPTAADSPSLVPDTVRVVGRCLRSAK
jgi:hypothetical protein